MKITSIQNLKEKTKKTALETYKWRRKRSDDTDITIIIIIISEKNSCLIILFSRPMAFLLYYYFLFLPSSTRPWVAAREDSTAIVRPVVVIKTAANVFHNSRRPLIIISTGLYALPSPQFFIAIVLLSPPLQTYLRRTIGDLIKTRGAKEWKIDAAPSKC